MFAPPVSDPYEPFVVVPKAFTERQCDRIAALADSVGLVDAGLQDADGSTGDDEIRRSQVAWIGPDDDTGWIFERLATVALRANRSYGFELTGFGEDLQLTAYDEADFYTWHIDGLDSGVAHRKLSIVVQLSDPAQYRGSLLEFLPVVTDYDNEQLEEYRRTISARGTAVVFPSFEYHRVTPLESGRRLSLVSWVSGPRFR